MKDRLLANQTTMASITTDMLSAIHINIRQTELLHPNVAAARVVDVMLKTYADSTLSHRRALFQRYQHYCALFNLPINDNSAVIFIEATANTTQVQTRHQYGKELHAVLGSLGTSTTTLGFYLKGLRSMGALVPLEQATPMDPEHLNTFLNDPTIPEDAFLGLMLAWKTASRWADLGGLINDEESFPLLTREEIIVDWGRGTKTTRQDPFRAQKYAVIQGNLTEQIHDIISTRPRGQPLIPMSTDSIRALLAAMCEKHRINKNYTAHSIKHGAANILMLAASQKLVSFQAVTLLLKHKATYDLVAMTVRYVQDRVAMARALGTQEATLLL